MHVFVSSTPELRCVVCHDPFDFVSGEAALVLRHVAYGYDFVHDGTCLTAATELFFPEPGYDCEAFARDPERRRVLAVGSATGWIDVRGERLRCWVLIEHRDGTTSMEGVIRDDEWLDEPGGAEFATHVRRPRAVFEYQLRPAGPHHPDSVATADDSGSRWAAALVGKR